MGLRRAVAGTAGHGHRFLSLTDNMSSLLAFDRGRSCSYDLLRLCRRAGALCIGADVSWTLRHLETWRGPSDSFGRARFMRSSAQPLPLIMFLELWLFRFVTTQIWQIPCNMFRLIPATLALSTSFLMEIRGSRPLSMDVVLMSSSAAT